MSRLSFKMAPRHRREPPDFIPVTFPIAALILASLIGAVIWLVILYAIVEAAELV